MQTQFDQMTEQEKLTDILSMSAMSLTLSSANIS